MTTKALWTSSLLIARALSLPAAPVPAKTDETAAPATGQVVFPKVVADVTAPANGILMHPEYANAVGRLAYIWGWPMVSAR